MTAPRVSTIALFLALATLGAACAEAPPPRASSAAEKVDPAEQARIDEGRKKLDRADDALDKKAFDDARKLLQEAAALNVESQRFEIEEAFDKLDKKEAKAWANDASDALANKQCKAAFATLAERMHAIDSDRFTREVQRLVGEPASTCLQAKIDEATTAGKFAEARALVAAEPTKLVLGAAWQKVSAELSTLIGEAMKGIVAADVKAAKWQDAVGKLDEAVKKGDASEAEIAAALASVRSALAPELVADADRSLGKTDAPKTLERIDGLVRLVKWEALSGEAAEIAKDRALPEEVRAHRDALATWVEASHLRMKPSRRAEKRFVWGKLAMHPATKADGESKRDLAPSSEVWVLGETKDRALVALAAPASTTLPAMMAAASGWVPKDRLAAQPTADWIAPDAELQGTMVWAPLRAPDPLLELGTVTEVKGKDAMVKRVADDKIIQVAKSSLRNGHLAPGLKVVTFCTAKGQVATVTELLPAGRGVKLTCDGLTGEGSSKEELLPSLRTKVELLPKGKP